MPSAESKTDLHSHTDFSDGELSPEQLLEEAQWNGLSAIAITDHDTVEGLERSCAAGRERGIEIVNGVELSCEQDGMEAHIVGLLIEPDEAFRAELVQMRRNRETRMAKMVRNLQLMGMDISMEDLLPFDVQALGRPHLARAMVKKKLVRNVCEAFEKYIGDDGPAYAAKQRWTVEDGIKLVHSVKGVSILAHPGASNLVDSIDMFIKFGIMGLEVKYPKHSPEIEKRLLDICRSENLVASGGSDYHSSSTGPRLGVPYMPYEMLERIKERKEQTWPVS